MKLNGNIIAHRGIFNNVDIPENSISAFNKAVLADIPIELDVQLTKDNVLVVFHDDNLVRMTKKNNVLQEMYYDDIKNLRLLDTKEKIPTLKEVLKLVNDKVLIDIEIKNTKKVKEVCDILITELDGYNNYIIKSFSPKIVRYLKKNYNNLEVGLLINNDYGNSILNCFCKSKFIIKFCKADFISISKKLLKTKKFNKLSKDYPTLIWTIKKQDEIKNDNNLIYICNNLPYKK